MANELMNIAEEIRQELKKSTTSWIRLGEMLDRARHSPGMESDPAFGKWCKEQEFGVGRQALLHYRLSWQEFTANHDLQEKITDYNAWSRIASLNHIQKPRVLERLAKAQGKVTRRDVLAWIDQTRVQPEAPKPKKMTKAELEKALKRAEAAENSAARLQQYYESLIREMGAMVNGETHKLIRSVLHSDREVEQERKDKAFDAWQKFHDKILQVVSKVA